MDSTSPEFSNQSPSQLAATKLGSNNPTIQLLNLLERVEKLERTFQSAEVVNKAVAKKVSTKKE
jgi:hypothetical protein